ncbi:MAG: glucosamine-6-phosphate deaminase [Acholeplasmataceae bacterium]|jgi:glucosamine-6-phosphate deaminase|nr:glucosamine-6-phosphate deaminase [Acholeplasmataceae bacterium]
MKIVIDEISTINKMVAKEITKLVKNNPNAVLGLATGGTPLGIYENLVLDYKENKTNYENVTTFNLDEYVGLDINHEQSYHTYMRKNLFNHININLENTHFPTLENPQSYTKLIKEKSIDIQILGVGSNGHIGFNEPGTSFDSETGYVTLAESTIEDNKRFFDSIEDVPTSAVTMGLKDIMSAKRIMLIAFGKNKAQAIKQLINGKEDEAWPLTILKRHPYVTVYLDKEAASLIE